MLIFLSIRYKLFFLILGVAGIITRGYAQEENVWTFGIKAGINFNTDPPTPIMTSINTREGCASTCDDNGQLLFYTDGTSVWDRNGQLMPNGLNLPGTLENITRSTAQGALIVPMPETKGKYYVFSLGNWEDAFYFGRLYYSIVDMSLNNGLGDVVGKGILLDSLLTEQMTAVSGNTCNVWLLVLSRSDTTFKAYNIDISGIDPSPVISPRLPGAGRVYGSTGCIDVSPDRNQLAIGQDNLVLYNFDANSGKISHPLMLDGIPAPVGSYDIGYSGVCFSPDNTKLYASSAYQVCQFDLSLNDTDAIKTSKTVVGKQFYGTIKRGPDGKIYGANGDILNSLNVINQPDLAGMACQFVAKGFPLLPGTFSVFGLPNSAVIVTNRKIYHSITDTVFCSNHLLLTANDSSGINYKWENGSTGSTRVVDSTGIYWISYQVNLPCILDEYVDTFHVVFDHSIKNINTTTVDSGICKEDTILMKASNLTGSNYTWENGSTGMQRSVNRTGIYWLHYQIDSSCEDHVDSFIITYPEKKYRVSFTSDTLICQNNFIQFQNTSDPHFNYFKWYFGNEDSSIIKSPQHPYTGVGGYEVMLTGHINEICADTVIKKIIVDSLFAGTFLAQPDSICTGETIAFSVSYSNSSINNRYWQFGDGTEMAGNENEIQHAYEQAGILPVTLTTRFRACPDTSFTDTVHIYNLPEIYLGADTSLCLNDQPVILRNLQAASTKTHHNLWNTGDTTESLKVIHPGIYSLTVNNEPLGCSNTAFIKIIRDCYIDIPNAFTPNGDGQNDYFFPRQLLSQSLTQFKLQIFNRWGQLLFETTQMDGRGWDGRFNGREQPEGVYVYVINAEIDGIKAEHYTGNVTLIR